MIKTFEQFVDEIIDDYYYHSAPNSVVDEILKNGLRGKKPSSGRLHDEEREKDEDSEEDSPPNKERIYLSYSDWDVMKFGNGYTIFTVSENAIKDLDVYSDFEWDGIYVTSKDRDEVTIHPKYIKIFKHTNESTLYGKDMNDYPSIVYHGTTKGHDFESPVAIHKEYLKDDVKCTFFSTEKFFAAEYMGEWKGEENGKLYEVHLKPNLNIFDTRNFENCKLLIDKFGEFEDDVELYDGDGYIIDSPEKLFNLWDNWFAIEYQDGCLDWLSKNYDGVIVFENVVKNVIIFDPVKEKIESYKEI